MNRKDITLLIGSPLFSGFSEEELSELDNKSFTEERQFKKGEMIHCVGDRVDRLGVVLDGRVHIEKLDYWGNRHILKIVEPADIFAEAFAVSSERPILNDVCAAADSRVLFIDLMKLINDAPSEPFTVKMLYSLLAVSSDRNKYLVRKLGHITHRTTREKVLSYLSEQAAAHGSSSFDIPFDRQELADYLAVDRSALSAELGRMKRDGLIDFRKSRFTVMHSGIPL